MEYSVSTLSIACMAVAAMVGVMIPVGLLLVFLKKFKANMPAFFVGCSVFIVFALIIEATLHRLILPSAIGLKIQSNVWLFAVYGGLMAGIFEETGRYIAFKTLLRKKSGNDSNALMYGAGHGGFEVFYLLTVSMISNISMAVMLNAGKSGKMLTGVTDETTRKMLEATFAFLANTPPASFLVGIVERLAAVAVHISLSVLVWFAAKDKGRFWLYPLAVILHAGIDVVAVIMSRNGLNIWLVETVLYVITICFIMIARNVWKKSVPEQVSHIITGEVGM